MKKKALVYLIIGIIGIMLIVLAVVLDGRVSDKVDAPLMGVGAGLMAVGITLWRFSLWVTKDPVKWKQYVIESRDERNAAIRLRAQAVAGVVLQYTVLAAAWVAIFLDAPMWVILATVGIFLSKTIIEMCLMARYQKKM